MDREETIKRVAMARFVNEKMDEMRKLKLTDSELKNITYLEFPDSTKTIEISDKINYEPSSLDRTIAVKVLLERWRERYDEGSFVRVANEINNSEIGQAIRLTVTLKRSGWQKLFSRQNPDTETIELTVTDALKYELN